MENWGCVTWTDSFLHRSPPTYGERAFRGLVLLHEMAHMWFGDLVTMRWWDDLWLNEAFASFASCWACASATEYTDAWAAFLADEQTLAYRQDMGPASHPIRTHVPDVGHAFASFDAITYFKGQAVLAQLMAYVSEDTFVEGLRSYFRDHAYGNAELSDLMSAIGAAADQDLAGWTASWLDQAGTDTISLVGSTLLASSPDGGEPRRHALRVGSYDRTDAGLEKRGEMDVQTTGTTTYLTDLPVADVHLLNDGDLTFASVRTDESSLQLLLTEAAGLAGGGQPGGGRLHGLGHAGQGRARDRRLPRLRAGRAGDRAEPRRGRAVLRARPGGRRAVEPRGPGAPPAGPAGRGGRRAGGRAGPPHRARCTRWRGPPPSPSTSTCSTTPPRTTWTWPGGSWCGAPPWAGTTRPR